LGKVKKESKGEGDKLKEEGAGVGALPRWLLIINGTLKRTSVASNYDKTRRK